jgi:ubiquinone biosynthesis protein Coq4
MNVLPEPVKLAKSINYIFDDGAHVRNIQMDDKMVHSTPVGEPQLLHSATTTTVTTKKIISIQHNSPQLLSPPTMSPNNGAFMSEPPPNQMNPNYTQKTIRHSYSPNRSQHTLIDKQYFYPLNINTQTHHIYHHVLPSHAPHTLQ